MANVLEFRGVSVVRSGHEILSDINWSVDEREHWVVLGPNGAGKSTLLQLAAATSYPTRGTVTVLGETLGRVNVFELRPRIGLTGSALAARIPPAETVENAVVTAAYGVTGRWREEYEELDFDRAREVLDLWGLSALAGRAFGTLSDGERKRVQLARAVMTDPEMLLLDEPASSLDLGAREELIGALSDYAAEPTAAPMVLVTHHVEEIPPGFTHALLLREGSMLAAGPIREVLTAERLSEAFGTPLQVEERDERFWARAR